MQENQKKTKQINNNLRLHLPGKQFQGKGGRRCRELLLPFSAGLRGARCQASTILESGQGCSAWCLAPPPPPTHSSRAKILHRGNRKGVPKFESSWKNLPGWQLNWIVQSLEGRECSDATWLRNHGARASPTKVMGLSPRQCPKSGNVVASGDIINGQVGFIANPIFPGRFEGWEDGVEGQNPTAAILPCSAHSGTFFVNGI